MYEGDTGLNIADDDGCGDNGGDTGLKIADDNGCGDVCGAGDSCGGDGADDSCCGGDGDDVMTDVTADVCGADDSCCCGGDVSDDSDCDASCLLLIKYHRRSLSANDGVMHFLGIAAAVFLSSSCSSYAFLN